MYEWRKSEHWIEDKCETCGDTFKHRIKDNKHCCSEECARSSPTKKKHLSEFFTINNPMHNQESIDKIGKTKEERYGDSKYNNIEKCKQTMIEKYGVECSFNLPSSIKSNGKRITIPQRKLYEYVKTKYNDALLEHYLTDIHISVDIFIPSLNLVIEMLGDWWHCNPNKYKEDYWHKMIHKTAKEVWKKDIKRSAKILNANYKLSIVWESEVKNVVKNDLIESVINQSS